jgi:delta24-sterol reductase
MKAFSVQDILTRHRGIVIFLFAVPVSFFFQKAQDFQNWIYRNFLVNNKLHDSNVRKIQDQVKKARTEGKMMCTARAPWKTMSIRKVTYKESYAQIPINLKNILELDTERNTVRVEPMATMGELTHFLIPRGYALAVQVEMDDLTLGGLCMGIGIETSSHKYGFLFETVLSYEIITANGTLVRASRDENADLFHSLPMSHGTLGFLVAVELKVVPVKKFMKLNYIPFDNLQSMSERMAELADSDHPPQFLEGLVFSAQTGVILAAEFADKPDAGSKINAINRWHKPWYYAHVESFLEKGEGIEFIPLRHYFHRHTPSVFFQLKDLIPFANKKWYRWFFAWMGAPKISLMKYSMTKELRKRALKNRVAQDIIIPIRKMNEALQYIDIHYGIYPAWICPVRLFDHEENEGFIPNPKNSTRNNSAMFVDIGIYGIPPQVKQGNWDSISTSRNLEHLTYKNHGFHMLYADIFMTREEFEQMFSHRLYREMREKYNADGSFPEVYDKVIPEKWLINLDEEYKKLSAKTETETIYSG